MKKKIYKFNGSSGVMINKIESYHYNSETLWIFTSNSISIDQSIKPVINEKEFREFEKFLEDNL